MERMNYYRLFTDGSCPLNPGPMGVGYVLGLLGLPPLVRWGEQIGHGTNNIAEYEAVIRGMRHALRLGIPTLDVYSDSNLLVRQVRGIYRVKDGTLKRLHREVGLLADLFDTRPMFHHIRREENAEADTLSRTLVAEEPNPEPLEKGRALRPWQAALVRKWYFVQEVRSSALLARIFGIEDGQIDHIVRDRSYQDATLAGIPTYDTL